MRKLLATGLALVFIISCFSGCGGDKWTPEQVSDDVAPYAQQAVKIIDSFLAFEITKDDAGNQAKDLYHRLNRMGIRNDNSQYGQTDKSIAWEIEQLEFGLKYDTDQELKQTRDVILYALGEKPSGRRDYPMTEDFDYSTDRFPAFFCDYMCGVDPFDLWEPTEKAWNDLSKGESDFSSVSVHYECYGRSVFSISVKRVDNGVFATILGHGSLSEMFVTVETLEDLRTEFENISRYFAGP